MDRFPHLTRIAPDLAEILEPEEAAALESALAAGDPEAERALGVWRAGRVALAEVLSLSASEDRALVLLALADQPHILSATEQDILEQSRADIEAAMEKHPGLQAVVARIRADRDAFEELWDRETEPARMRADRPALRPERSRLSRAGRVAWRVAAVAAVALFVAALLLMTQRDAGFETVRTAADETRLITLPDGSEVRLGPNASLAYRMEPGQLRQVRLSGEGLFDVVAGREVFVVETDAALVTVLATTFGVRTQVGATEVILVEGLVTLAARLEPEQAVRLEPGQRSRVVTGAAPDPPAEVDVAEALAWTGTWFFRAEPLAEIARRLSRHYGVEIAVPPELGAERITGSFAQDAPVEETLQTLASALGIRVERVATDSYRFTTDGG